MLYVLGQPKRQNYVHDVAINTIPLQYFPNNHHNKRQDHVADFELRTYLGTLLKKKVYELLFKRYFLKHHCYLISCLKKTS